ncbi:MAG: integration host factor subunit beta [Treponema sp.]|nr:integration host factor subunit beta [Treponema sp.]
MLSKKITKHDLVEAVYQNSKYEKGQIQEVIEAFVGELKKDIAKGCTIELRGFGTFEPRLRKGRAVVRNPKTGQTSSMQAHYVAVFRSGQELKKALSELPVQEN